MEHQLHTNPGLTGTKPRWGPDFMGLLSSDGYNEAVGEVSEWVVGGCTGEGHLIPTQGLHGLPGLESEDGPSGGRRETEERSRKRECFRRGRQPRRISRSLWK